MIKGRDIRLFFYLCYNYIKKRSDNLKIINKKVEELIPYINNPRKNDPAVDKVASSIKEFGFKVPIIIDKDNVIITGHTRLKASIKLGLLEVPCIIANDLTPAQIKAFRIADNKVSEFAEWDIQKLNIELEELEEFNFNFEEFGIVKIDEIEFDLGLEEELEDYSEPKEKIYICPHCNEKINKKELKEFKE